MAQAGANIELFKIICSTKIAVINFESLYIYPPSDYADVVYRSDTDTFLKFSLTGPFSV